ncbi:ExbD/TolR family protein [Acetobacteroides hydrogenigenes]|uniref:Biopolymer transport protein ExbD n=1 Tax=Acetobacteroides hydrogenigenes TaxID=979970 RepID=A0A4R2E596_9BACT|nr:biopolymer transporter ExbD [Acetobacteroides hydrogenigenes]TCN63093.1 biopolymer transport protein ExbD [Acetobacteroides hydrogenigenes]
MAGRATPEVNAGSMADIAFLLLIFFLVTTTMNSDAGLQRRLPPWTQEQKATDQEVNQRNVLMVLVNGRDWLMVNGQRMDVIQLREKVMEFVENPQNNLSFSERTVKNIPGIGNVEVSKGVISLQNDRGTSYKMYMEVQNEIVAAYNVLREKASQEKFGKKFDLLSEDEQEAIKKMYPQQISEANPRNAAGVK